VRSENTGLLTGAALSVAYFRLSESGQPQGTNCSYLAPASTDVLAVAAAGVLYAQARKTGNFWVSAVAGAIAGIHAQQYLHHKASQ
jgi:hypothetical protein